ncbi:MAG: hypothetical protein ACFFDI_25920, partial [Promethearchaeota archaeon]
FVDERRKGLFSLWSHEHRFVQGGWRQAPASMLLDEITYAHPLLVSFDLKRPAAQDQLKMITTKLNIPFYELSKQQMGDTFC